MSKVFLRVYNHEIENMIEGGQLDEAIAHCQHILKTFPMYLETYRLLGKAFLETRRYGDAADIFQRALAAVPDDFVSHVGMSIIRDDEGKLDDAIWHMERAFEIQPSNSAIQGELRRLYGRRDGVEPDKIRLTRDALANMYLQGDLFNQAIAEIRSILAEDPNRPDLQVMLALAYFRSGQKVEAAEMAAALLKKFPYCLDALRILVEVLPGSSGSENTQVYRQRLRLLDPYSSFVIDSVFTSNQVVDSAVNLERLEYRSSQTQPPSQPDWASSLGIKLNNEKDTGAPPEWMQSSEKLAEPEAPAHSSGESTDKQETSATVDSVPEWMRSAGWQQSTGEESEQTTPPKEEHPDSSIAKADLPDWLKSMVPSDISDEEKSDSDESTYPLPIGEDGVPEWLKSSAPKAANDKLGSEENQPQVESQSLTGTEVPEWFNPKTVADTNAIDDEGISQKPPEANNLGEIAGAELSEPVPTETGVTGMQEESQKLPALEASGEQEVPDWLKSMNTAESEDASEEDTLPPEDLGSANEQEIPDWLNSLATAETAQPVPSEESLPAIKSESELEDEGNIPDWLKSMAPSESIPDESMVESLTPSNEASETANEEEIPEWLQSISQVETAQNVSGVEPISPIIPEPADDKSLADMMNTPPSEELHSALYVEPEEVAELSPSEETEPASGQTVSEQSPADADAFPDWLTDMGARATAAEVTATLVSDNLKSVPIDEEPATEVPVTPELASDQPVSGQPASERPVTDQIVSEQPVSEQPISEQPVSEQPVSEQPVSTETTFPEPTVLSTSSSEHLEDSFQPSGEVKPLDIGDDALGWLENLAVKQGAKPEELLTTPQDRSDEMPDWLRQSTQTPVEESTSAPQQPAEKSAPTPEETLPIEQVEFNEPQASQPAHTIDEAFSEQVEPVQTGTNEILDESSSRSGGDQDDTLAWLEQLSSDEDVKTEETEPPFADENPASFDSVQKDLGTEPLVSETKDEIHKGLGQSTDDITITSWLSKKDVEEALIQQASSGKPQPESGVSEEDLPDWLKDLEKPVTSIESPQGAENLPGWLQDSAGPASMESDNQPVSMEPDLPTEGKEANTDLNIAAPTTPEEWLPLESKVDRTGEPSYVAVTNPEGESKPVALSIPEVSTPAQVESVPAPDILPTELPVSPVEPTLHPAQPPVKLPTLKQTGMLSHIPAQDKDAELLSDAQNILDQSSLDEAMKKYGKLIKKGRLLDEVIHDLREAIYRYPVDVVVWQTLGDAYMRANRLQDALDSYTKAEELLR